MAIDVAARQVRVGAELADLTGLEFDILVALARRPGRVVPRETLLGEAGRQDVTVSDRTVDVHVSHLRRKLGDDPRTPRLIKTVRGVGYVLSPEAARDAGGGAVRHGGPPRGGPGWPRWRGPWGFWAGLDPATRERIVGEIRTAYGQRFGRRHPWDRVFHEAIGRRPGWHHRIRWELRLHYGAHLHRRLFLWFGATIFLAVVATAAAAHFGTRLAGGPPVARRPAVRGAGGGRSGWRPGGWRGGSRARSTS